MKLYIPTRGRPRQRTVERLPQVVHDMFHTTLVCPPSERGALNQVYGNRVQVVACKHDGIAATRQFILGHTNDPVVLMVDDDLPTWCQRLNKTNEKGDALYKKADDNDIRAGLFEFSRVMRNYAHGSIGHRLFCQVKEPIYFNSRMLRALAYNVNLIGKAKFVLPVMEDFDMALQLLTAGEDAMIYNRLVQDQYSTNTAGGCSEYRTQQVQANAARALAARWPDYVTMVTRAPKREWVGFGGERVDVRVNWNKAAKDGGCKHAS